MKEEFLIGKSAPKSHSLELVRWGLRSAPLRACAKRVGWFILMQLWTMSALTSDALAAAPPIYKTATTFYYLAPHNVLPSPLDEFRSSVCQPYYGYISSYVRPCTVEGPCTYSWMEEDIYPLTCKIVLKRTFPGVGGGQPNTIYSDYQHSLFTRTDSVCPGTTLENPADRSTCLCQTPGHEWADRPPPLRGQCLPPKDTPNFLKPRPSYCPAPTDVPIPGLTGVGDPVYPLTGTTTQHVDLSLGLDRQPIVMTYESAWPLVLLQPINTPTWMAQKHFPIGWSSTLHRALVLQLDGPIKRVISARGDGTFLTFVHDGTGWKSPDPDRTEVLRAEASLWLLLDRNGTRIESYDSDGALQRIDFATGRTIRLKYSDASTPATTAPGAGYLIGAEDSFGRKASWRFRPAPVSATAFGIRAVSATSADGRETTFRYSSFGDLESIGWPDATSVGFRYQTISGQPGFLVSKLDESGQTHLKLGYDASGRAISTELGSGQFRFSTTYSTPPALSTSTVVDTVNGALVRTFSWTPSVGAMVTTPTGSTLSMGSSIGSDYPRLSFRSQPAGSGCGASLVSAAYDNNGNPHITQNANGSQTCRSYDQARNLETARVEGLADGSACTATAAGAALPAGARKTSTLWHPDWSLRTRQAEPGRVTTWVYNGQPDPYASGALASCAPASAVLPDGKPIAVLCRQVEQATDDTDGAQGFAAPVQSNVPAREQKWTYNAFGQVLTHDGPRTDVADITAFEYYTDTSFTGADPNAVGHTLGDLKQTTSPAGHVTRYTQYNKMGQVLQMLDPNGVVTSYTYDARQRLTSTTTAGQTTVLEYWPTGLLKRTTQADLSWVHQDYDDAHRLTRVSDNLGNSISYTLDNLGNRIAEEVRDPSNSLRRVLSRSIDALGRVQQVTGRE